MELVKDGELDYIYIDARHDYCAAHEDIESKLLFELSIDNPPSQCGGRRLSPAESSPVTTTCRMRPKSHRGKCVKMVIELHESSFAQY